MTPSLPDYILFALGLLILLGGAELLVSNAVKLATKIGKSGLFVGLTITAFGTSAPELAIGITGLLSHNADIGLGNVVGSNIFNILFVLGLAAILRPIKISRPIILRDIPILFGTSIVFYLLVLDRELGRVESLVLLLLLTAYLVYLTRVSKKDDVGWVNTNTDHSNTRSVVTTLAMIGLSIAIMVLASRWMVAGAVSIASSLGVSQFAVGLTIVAVGTSLPEVATSIAAVRQGQPEMAVGNVIGSCFFNIAVVPAAMALISTSALSFAAEAVTVDIPIMIMTVVACMPIFLSDHRISRSEGVLFISYFIAFLLMLYYRNASESVLSQYRTEVALLGLPILAITLVNVTVRAVKRRRHSNGGQNS